MNYFQLTTLYIVRAPSYFNNKPGVFCVDTETISFKQSIFLTVSFALCASRPSRSRLLTLFPVRIVWKAQVVSLYFILTFSSVQATFCLQRRCSSKSMGTHETASDAQAI